MLLAQLAPQARQGQLGLQVNLEQVFIIKALSQRRALCLPPAMLTAMLILFLMMIIFIFGMDRLGTMLGRLRLALLARQAQQDRLAL